MHRIWTLSLACMTLAACHRSAGPSTTPGALAGEWTLVELSGQPAPKGAGGRPATLAFDPSGSRVSGFAGCNRLSASYTASGDSLAFGLAGMTKMACAEGMDLEKRVAETLAATRGFRISGVSLTLTDESGVLARFERAAP
jgi:heat shock protein HslJ